MRGGERYADAAVRQDIIARISIAAAYVCYANGEDHESSGSQFDFDLEHSVSGICGGWKASYKRAMVGGS